MEMIYFLAGIKYFLFLFAEFVVDRSSPFYAWNIVPSCCSNFLEPVGSRKYENGFWNFSLWCGR